MIRILNGYLLAIIIVMYFSIFLINYLFEIVATDSLCGGIIRLTIASFCSFEYRTPFFSFISIDLRVIYLKYNTKVSYDIYPNRGG